MTFTVLNSAAVDLWSSLRSFVCEDAVREITVRPPVGENDETSFLRLVVWSYALAFEAGRITIPYLIELPADKSEALSDPKKSHRLVHDLRTWSFHNLGYGSDRDIAISRHVQLWFIQNCKNFPPENAYAWRKCFLALCSEVGEIIAHCKGALINVLSSSDDGQAATEDLRRRIERFWPAHEFHKIVNEAAFRLGISVDDVKFSTSKLAKWRSFLEIIPNHDSPKQYMTRMIERDLLDHAADVLPIDGKDVMNVLRIEPGPQVSAALYRARELFRSGVRDPDDILKNLENRSFQI